MNRVDKYVYMPILKTQYRSKAYCAATTQSMWNEQCIRKPKHRIDRFGFCTQHAKKICERLDIDFDTLEKWEDE